MLVDGDGPCRIAEIVRQRLDYTPNDRFDDERWVSTLPHRCNGVAVRLEYDPNKRICVGRWCRALPHRRNAAAMRLEPDPNH